jgi:hypothetical protein
MMVAPHHLAAQAGLAVPRDGIAVTRSQHTNTLIKRPEIEDGPNFASSSTPLSKSMGDWSLGLPLL